MSASERTDSRRTHADEIYDGERCLVCEERILPADKWIVVVYPSAGCAHRHCWDLEEVASS